jgi:branched-subunit amino acid transport protein
MRGVIFSFVFTGFLTALIIKYVLPSDLGTTPYLMMGIVAFVIGWSSDRFSIVKTALLERISKLLNRAGK